ncbi:glmZ(sRNA)-inactivating NTPase [Candidatus Nitrosoglobus terrae]|uniref:GlmZ(SRNA)-inactivating NTPase n=1 Tax=Candidatus Nitrosoglobus terrae TaxID=1630141 RepID=A0A1Q2SPE3_9GAMM|nr:RNase adapter RapZ [Candidatus Nitrosoglobus terrae]BAW80996.1 glmZ(sRNA)-inactivating NTPase [Candidatus Nitrosoglobus terrae]
MRLIIISGVSGSGKSIALHALEDQGYYCIDNLPIDLLPHFAQKMQGSTNRLRAAVGIDVRNLSQELKQFPQILKEIESTGIECRIIFLDANDATLLKRFSETRRKHPFGHIPLAEAIRHERNLLEAISEKANLRIDTTCTTVHQLRDLISERIGNSASTEMSVLFQSFGYKHGVPLDADFVFDVRCLPNPHWEPHLRPLTGRDPEVISYLERHKIVANMKQDLIIFLQHWLQHFQNTNRSYLTVAIGCTGGQHRSVYLVEQLTAHFRFLHDQVLCRHRELS